jgi:hypothetical protein
MATSLSNPGAGRERHGVEEKKGPSTDTSTQNI